MKKQAKRSTVVPTPRDDLKMRLTLSGLILVTVLVVYCRLGSAGFVYDDVDYVVNNPHVISGLSAANIRWAFASSYSANWHPLTWISHMIDCGLFGLNPGTHHLVNVTFHIINSLLLFLLLMMITRTIWQSWVVAMLFAIHPMHVESVAWISDRKDLLCTMFWLLALITYARYVKKLDTASYIGVLLLFALGIMTKPVIVTLPLTLLILDWWPLERFDKGIRPLLIEKLPFFVAAAISCALTLYAQSQFGAIVTLDYIPWGLRISNALIAYGSYIRNLIWPIDLAVYYPITRSIPLWQPVSVVVALAAITALTLKARQQRYLAAGWAWFLITLVPMIGLVQVGAAAMADRYSYVPYVGLFIIVVFGAGEIAGKDKRKQNMFSLAGAAAIVIFAALAWEQTSYWKDGFTLWHHAAEVTTNNERAYHSLGALYDQAGALEGSAENYRKALAIEPTHAEVQNNLGSVLWRLGQHEEAERYFVQAVQLDGDNADAHNNLGTALAQKGDLTGASAQFRLALKLDPGHQLAKKNLDLAIGMLAK